MGQIIVRQLDDKVLSRIKTRAKANKRSAEAEVRDLLTRAVNPAKATHKSLASLAGAGQSGRSAAEIEDYVKMLRDEWDR